MAETAKKKHPEKWERAKRKARKKMGGHSARAMQLATKYYKEMGGKYEGKKSTKNKLSKWSKEDWQTREEYEKKKKRNVTHAYRTSLGLVRRASWGSAKVKRLLVRAGASFRCNVIGIAVKLDSCFRER